MNYKQSILQELKKVYGDEIPQFIACNPYGGGTNYFDEEHELRDSGYFEFETVEKLDEFLKNNKHCYCLKEGNNIY